MNNILLNNQCKIVNIVWIDRGIILTLIYYICKKYNKLLDKIIIINNTRYSKFLKYIFPKLKFRPFKDDHPKNFYFNIRTIIKKQDIIIDYLNNYDDYINAKKLRIIPWYDMNDVLISYEYNSNQKVKLKQYFTFLNRFKCIRGNYISKQDRFNKNIFQSQIWDLLIENKILYKYKVFNPSINISYAFNTFIKSGYTNTVIEYPKIYYVPINIQEEKPEENNEIITNIIVENKSPPKNTNEIGINTDPYEPSRKNTTGIGINTDPEEPDDPFIPRIMPSEPLRTMNFDNIELIKLITKKLNLINEINMKKMNV